MSAVNLTWKVNQKESGKHLGNLFLRKVPVSDREYTIPAADSTSDERMRVKIISVNPENKEVIAEIVS